MANYGVYTDVAEVFDRFGGRVVVDSAFQMKRSECIIKSSQQDPIGDRYEVAINQAATSVRQLSEWGMRMIKGQFPRLKEKLRMEDFNERKIILNLMVLLYNMNTSELGINQILNSFMSKTEGYYNYQSISETANNIFK